MECAEFLARFSEYYDDVAGDRTAFEEHLDGCAACRRYVEVVGRGVEILKSMPGPELRSDFHPRLQHRIFHADEHAVAPGANGSATTVGTALAIGVVLAMAAWSPTMRERTPEVSLPAIVVSDPPAERAPRLVRPTGFLGAPTPSAGSSLERSRLWTRTLYEYSELSERYPATRLFRVGLD